MQFRTLRRHPISPKYTADSLQEHPFPITDSSSTPQSPFPLTSLQPECSSPDVIINCFLPFFLQGLAQMLPITYVIFIHFLLIEGQLLYSVIMVSATHPHELAIGILMPCPS